MFGSNNIDYFYGSFAPSPMFGNSFGNVDVMALLMQTKMQQDMMNLPKALSGPNYQQAPTVDFKAGNHKKIPLSAECRKQIAEMAKDPKINCNASDIENLIYSESGGDPKARNKKSGAVGLIQWVPRYHPKVASKVANLSAEEQMPYVKRYLIDAKKKAGFAQGDKLSSGQLYALVFMPAKAKKDVMCSAGTTEYAWNKGLDTNHDGIITGTELGNRIS